MARQEKKYTLPKGDRYDANPVVTCERGHEWYVHETDDSMKIHVGCHEFYTWADAFEHYELRNWYRTSEFVSDSLDTHTDEDFERIRKRCIQRLNYLKQKYKANGGKDLD